MRKIKKNRSRLGGYDFVDYSNECFPDLAKFFQDFVPNHWPANHIYHDEKMFNWQYEGFGHKKFQTIVVYDRHTMEVVGYRGAIPGLFQVPDGSGGHEIIEGQTICGWMVSLRNDVPRGLGLELHYLLQERAKISAAICFGTGLATAIYRKSRFNVVNALQRYVLPLEHTGYTRLCSKIENPSLLKRWIEVNEDRYRSVSSEQPCNPSNDTLQNYWTKIGEHQQFFGLYRCASFWDWRYKRCPNNRYFFWEDPSAGLIVGRIEQAFSNQDCSNLEETSINGIKVFRVIEIMPASGKFWRDSVPSSDMQALLIAALLWARGQGCVAADFQFSNTKFDMMLQQIGFRYQREDYSPSECSLAGLFQPLAYKPKTINFAWRLRSQANQFVNDVSNVYMVKSDGAADHPKTWPLPVFSGLDH